MKTYRWRIFFKILFNYVIPLGLGIAILWYLTAIYQSDSTAFWPRASLIIASIAAIFAGLSALAARQSLEKTRESLELTRNAIRPFISSSGMIPISYTPDTVTLTFNIQNSGSIPGNDVYTHIDFFDEDEEVTEDNLSNKYPPPNRQSSYGIMLPNDIHYEKYILDLKDKGDLELWENIEKGKVKFRLRIMYKSFGRKHLTLQTEKIVKLKGQKELQLIPDVPQKWE